MKLKINRVVRNWKFANEIFIENSDFHDNGFGRRFKMQDSANHWEDAFAEFGLKPTSVEPMFKNFIGNHFKDEAFVHPHTDPAPNEFVHARCNLMLKKPLKGGNPILDGEEIDIEQNDLWLCLASLEEHSSTPIKEGERLVFSFGGLVPIEQINKIIA
jgi:hypothetical protein